MKTILDTLKLLNESYKEHSQKYPHFGDGICFHVARLKIIGTINEDETKELLNYIVINKPANAMKIYWFPHLDFNSRLGWLKEHIELNESKVEVKKKFIESLRKGTE